MKLSYKGWKDKQQGKIMVVIAQAPCHVAPAATETDLPRSTIVTFGTVV